MQAYQIRGTATADGYLRGRDGMRRIATSEEADQILRYEFRHAVTRFLTGRGDMWCENDVIQLSQTRTEGWLSFEDI